MKSRNGKYDTYTILVRKPEGKRTLERSSSRWKNNIKMYLKNYVKG
jgi:hypothetical protein